MNRQKEGTGIRCEICAYEYKPYRKTDKYCSDYCRKESRRKELSMYEILGGDGHAPIYGMEGVWYYPDGSTEDESPWR
jgi:hypothetical protein